MALPRVIHALVTLETAGYVRMEKDFLGKKARTWIAITREGRRAFDLHVVYLRDMLNGISFREK